MELTSDLAARLRKAALTCSEAGGDAESVQEFVQVLRCPIQTAENVAKWQSECEGLLNEASSLLDSSAPSGKELMDYVGGELPKVLVEYLIVSEDCRETATRLLQSLAATFDPAREMFTAFFEALNMYSNPRVLQLCIPLLHGLSLVFPRIRRRSIEFFKEAMPGLVEVGRSAGQTDMGVHMDNYPDVANTDTSCLDSLSLRREQLEGDLPLKVINELICFAKVTQGVCDSAQDMQRLRNLLGIFTLQLLSVAYGAVKQLETTSPDICLALMMLLSYCNPSVSLLTSVTEIDEILDAAIDEEDAKAKEYRLDAKRGAALAAYWVLMRREESDENAEEYTRPKTLHNPGRRAVLAIVSLASTLFNTSCVHETSMTVTGLNLMTAILKAYRKPSVDDDMSEPEDGLDLSIQISPALQGLQNMIFYVPSPTLRRRSYDVMIKIITDVLPAQARFVTLRGLIINSTHPSLISLLLTCVKDEVLKSWPSEKGSPEGLTHGAVGAEASSSLSPFTTPEVLEFVHCVLRTKEGNPADIPTSLDAVIGALNLYRFLLIKELAGNTNYTHVLSKDQLTKGLKYWLLPVREEVLRVQSVLKSEGPVDAREEIELELDILQSIIYRCVEIVESHLAKLK